MIVRASSENCPGCGGAMGRRRAQTISKDSFPAFELVRPLGSGGMGVVFEAVHLETDKKVAIKVLRPHLARDPAYLVRFFEEVRLLTLVKHPNIVRVYGRGRANDLPYIAMELVPGPSVRQRCG